MPDKPWKISWTDPLIDPNWHVIPIDDIAPHTEAKDCACKPYLEPNHRGGDYVIHRSFDGRELAERDYVINQARCN